MPASNPTTEHSSYYRYWGKASKTDPAAYHLLPYHCLDVAAVVEVLLAQNRIWQHRIAVCMGAQEASATAVARCVSALHDVGKFSDRYQNLRPELLQRLRGITSHHEYRPRHDVMSLIAMREAIRFRLGGKRCAGGGGLELDPLDWAEFVEPFFLAAAGHHGTPCQVEDRAGVAWRLDRCFSSENCLAVAEFSEAVLRLSGGETGLPAWNGDIIAGVKRGSWLLAGLVVLADWIGSNSEWFPMVSDVMELADYWRDRAVPQAERAVRHAAVIPSRVETSTGMARLFRGIDHPSPLQDRATALDLPPGPNLIVIEESTGAGKTEAALVLAHRLMAMGEGDGFYLGLPTMATADGMFERLHKEGVRERLYAEGENPSLILAHSARHLSDLFEHSVAQWAHDAEEDTGLWLADHRKKALLGSIGIGTIDQALVAILPSRHQSLRMLGLARNVLIVDEVHACDAYMHQLLQSLLQFHAAFGGSAIVLSATLNTRKRQQLVDSFCEGAGWQKQTLRMTKEYPLLTHVVSAGLREEEVQPRPGTGRTVIVQMTGDRDAVLAAVEKAAADGRCVCWIRNTVQDAVEAYRLLAGTASDGKIRLFHARFAMGDRLAIEAEVRRTFGPKGTAAERAGQVLVATQVVEQSLDLDFDLLVTDLAPIDRIIQRAGRVSRHVRDAHGNRKTGGPDERGDPRVIVFGPTPVDSPEDRWFNDFFPAASWVYPNHGQLWITARLLANKGRIRIPEDCRAFVEHVFDSDAVGRVPPTLQEKENRCAGDRSAHASFAMNRALKPESGYKRTWDQWVDDTVAQTRLGDSETTVRLARWVNGKVVPWSDAERHAWALSDVSVRSSLVASAAALPSDRQAALGDARKTMPDEGKWCVVVLLEERQTGSWIGKAINKRGQEVEIEYNRLTGITVACKS